VCSKALPLLLPPVIALRSMRELLIAQTNAGPFFVAAIPGTSPSPSSSTASEAAISIPGAKPPTSGSGGGTASRTYVGKVEYADHGAVKNLWLSGYLYKEAWTYPAARPTQVAGIALEYCAANIVSCAAPVTRSSITYTMATSTPGTASGPDNNGNPRTQTAVVNGKSFIESYDYDGWNRLKKVRDVYLTAELIEEYCYDAHGNRAVVARPGLHARIPSVSTCTPQNVEALFPVNNRVALLGYDASGALANDQQSSLLVDAEDRLWESTPVGGGGVKTSYRYDGDGKRVSRQRGAEAATIYVYDAFGQLAAEYGGVQDLTGTGPWYLHTDALGSTRVVVDAASGTVVRRMDYWPFGLEKNGLISNETPHRTAADGYGVRQSPTHRFTGKERDAETGLDYFGARYMSAAQGRFTSPDPLLASGRPEDPQSWNRYAYTLNNPLRFIDPSGMKEVSAHECAANPDCIKVQVNIVLDKNANLYDKKGNLKPEYQKNIDEQIAQARDEYGSLGIHFDVTYSQGTVDSKSRTIASGAVESAINVALTDSNVVSSTNFAAGGQMKGKMTSIALNMWHRDVKGGTLGHEIAHFLNGETRSQLAGAVNLLTVGTANAVADIMNDARRSSLRGAEPFSQGWGYSKYGRYESSWRTNARQWYGRR
jgi:RHS repeat-associated protein